MSNILEFYVKMKDMMSGGLVKIASTAKSSFEKVSSQVEKVQSKNKMLSMSYDEIGRKIKAVEQQISGSRIPSEIRAARRELESLQKLQNNSPGNTGKGSGGGFGLSSLLGGIVPALGVGAIMAFGGKALHSGLNAQARQASFEVLAGKETGTQLNKGLTKYAQDSIYGTEVNDNAKTMLGFGIAAKDVLPNIKMLGDVAMGDANKLQSLTLAFSQVHSAGKLTGQDMLQFVNAGFNPLKEIADMTGKSMSTLKDEMSKGAISADMVQKAFVHATSEGGKFYKMAETIGNTDFGKWQAFQGSVDALVEKIGSKLAPILGSLVTNYLTPMLEVIQSLGVAVMVLGRWLNENADWFGLLAVAIGSASLAYGAYYVWMNAITWATIAQTVVMGGLTNAWNALKLAILSNPIGFIIAGIAALVAGIIYAYNHFEGFRKVVWGLWGAFKQVFENIGNFFKQTFDPIFKAIDYFKKGEYAKAGLEVLKLGYNISPVGLAVNATKFALDGGFTKGVKEAALKESLKGVRTASGIATPEGADMKTAFDSSSKFNSSSNEQVASGITSGGPRVININGVKFAEKIEFRVQDMKEGAERGLQSFEEMFLRVLNSGAAMQ